MPGQPQQLLGPFHLLLRLGRVQEERQEHAAVPQQSYGGEDEGVVQLHEVLEKEQHVHFQHRPHGEQHLLRAGRQGTGVYEFMY